MPFIFIIFGIYLFVINITGNFGSAFSLFAGEFPEIVNIIIYVTLIYIIRLIPLQYTKTISNLILFVFILNLLSKTYNNNQNLISNTTSSIKQLLSSVSNISNNTNNTQNNQPSIIQQGINGAMNSSILLSNPLIGNIQSIASLAGF